MLAYFSSGVSFLSAAMAVLSLLLAILYYVSKSKGLPPGPTGIPYLGYWPFLNNDSCHLQLQDFHNKYGDVFSLTAAGRLFIYLGSHTAMREAHVAKSEFLERITDFNLYIMTFSEGFSFGNGERWKVLRKFFVKSFKEWGLTSINDNIAEPMSYYVNQLVEELRGHNGRPVNISKMILQKSTRIMRGMLFGDTGYTEEQSREMEETYSVVVESMTAPNLLLNGIIARYLIFPLTSHFYEGLESHKRLKKVLYNILKNHEDTIDENHNRDMIDSFFNERDDLRRKGDPTAKYFTDKALVSTLIQIIGDGTVEVAAFVASVLQLILQYPREQDKIYTELLEVIGPDRQPTVEDKANLPYINAFLYEAVRMSDIFPFFPSFECNSEITLQGYRIPKGSVTVLNIWSANHNPKVYEEPYKFNPSRFMSISEKQRPELPMMFGIGKRNCIGGTFVMTQTFLFLTVLVRAFHMKLYDDGSPPVFKNRFRAGSWKMCCVPRRHN